METCRIQSADGTPLRLGRWSTQGAARGEVLIVHGLAEHAERYEHVGQALTDAGWRATVVELRGHGESGGKRGHVDAWSDYLDDVRAALARIGAPVILLAHSMGGLVVLDLLRDPPPLVRGFALSDPLIAMAFEAPRLKLAAAGLLSKVLPRLSLNNELDPNLISRDAEVVRRYVADPMVYDTITPRWFTEMQAARKRVQAHASRYTLPGLLMLGTGDRICDWKQARAFAEHWPNGTIREYDGLYHEILNEPEQAQVLSDLVAWLNAQDLS